MKEHIEQKDKLTDLHLYQACLLLEEVNQLVKIRGFNKLDANGWETYIKNQVTSLIKLKETFDIPAEELHEAQITNGYCLVKARNHTDNECENKIIWLRGVEKKMLDAMNANDAKIEIDSRN